MKFRFLHCLAIALGCAFADFVNAQPDIIDARRKMWQKRLDSLPFVFIKGSNGPLPSLERFSGRSKIHIVYDPVMPGQFEFQFATDGSTVLSLKGDHTTSFAGGDGKLFFAEYEPNLPGCTIVAYDLASGAEIWRTKLHQSQPAGASAYQNRVTVALTDISMSPDREKELSVIIKGSESYCDYVEVLDATSGESLAIKKYRVGFGGMGVEPENGPALVQVLLHEYRIEAFLSRESQIYSAAVTRDAEVNSAIDRLSRIDTLERVAVLGGAVDKELLEKLGKLPKLRDLRFGGCRIQDADLDALKNLPKLRELDFGNTPITDAGLVHLTALKDLEILRLSGSMVTGTGFGGWPTTTRLKYLTLDRTPVTVDGAKDIGNLSTLQTLSLGNTKLTDEALQHLSGMYRLQALGIIKSQVTQGGYDDFLKAHAKSRAEAEKKGLIPKDYPQLEVVGAPEAEKPRIQRPRVL